MKRLTTLPIVLCLACLNAYAEDLPLKEHPDSAKRAALFSNDLSNADFPADVRSVKDGEITATKDQCLWTKDQYENFTLDLEFKLGDAANSGVIVYCSDKKNWIPNSVEIQILDDAAPKWQKEPVKEYVLVRKEIYQRLKGIVDDDDARLMYPQLAKVDPEDWEDASNYQGKP